jgi:signal transduction histidine kinase
MQVRPASHAGVRAFPVMWAEQLFSERFSDLSARGIALTVAATFAVGGLLWVLLTDLLLYGLARDPVLIARIETAKGWAFIALGAFFIYVVTVRSASRLARDRAAITAIIESIADGVLLLGRDRRIHRANPTAAKMLRCGELVGMGVDEFARRFRVSYPNGSVLPVDGFISQRVFDEGGPLSHKIVVYPEHGPELIVVAKAAAVRTSVDMPADLVVSVMHDITDAARFERLRDDFFSAAAHSLKTPLAIIKSNAEIVASVVSGEPAESAAAISRQCDQMDLLLQNLLVLARVGSNTLELHPGEIELKPLVERVVERVGSATSGECALHCELSASPRIHADAERLALALRNLIEPACRLSQPGSPVRVLMTLQGKNVEVGVRHTNVPAHAGDAARQIAADELGVKRLVASTIVECHGGTLRSEDGGAETTAWVRLPVLE